VGVAVGPERAVGLLAAEQIRDRRLGVDLPLDSRRSGLRQACVQAGHTDRQTQQTAKAILAERHHALLVNLLNKGNDFSPPILSRRNLRLNPLPDSAAESNGAKWCLGDGEHSARYRSGN
jgi:hypothetical protein